ncbi:hypothetical protein SEA_DARDANUS_50 [Gordonia phage Dardanus]|uniref:Uncharacterized protein n=1 Tax=Gordonia phage Dardanus TaxID=2588489 RepID=A0A514CX37_9CAUD|nr:hypothetical protein KDJ58_gp50 [Gordonia phage Dardanus]QDH85087.1 hypothetical protein SEA_DARDANUS_50 [Gordonia phage Dardanus]
MANATLNIDTEAIAKEIAGLLGAVDAQEHERVKGERDEARRTLTKIVRSAMPTRFADEADPLGAARRLFSDWQRLAILESGMSREVARAESRATSAEQTLATVRDQLDEARRQADEAQRKLAGDGVLAKGAVMVHEGNDPYAVLKAGEVVTVVHGKVDADGDVKVSRAGMPAGDYEFARVANLKPRKRVYEAGDPEPEDKTLTLTGTNERGRTVELKHGAHGAAGELVAWWDVRAQTKSAWGYWLDNFGPLTEV